MLAVSFVGRALVRQFQQRDQIGVVHAEHRPVVGHGGIHHHIRQPLGRGDDFRIFIPAFPRLGVERLFLADFQQRIARERIHRHDAAVRGQRQPAEFGEGEIFVLRRLQIAEKPQRHHEHQRRRRPFLKNLFHFFLLVWNKADQVIHELDHQTQPHHRAADVRRQPARIADHLQHRGRRAARHLRGLAGVHLVLVISVAAVAQRMVHGNFHLALLAGLRIVQQHAAAKILGNVRARINRVRGLEQRQRKGKTDARRPQREGVWLSVRFNRLRRDELRGDFLRQVRAHCRVAVAHRLDQRRVARPVARDPGAERAGRRGKFQHRRRDVALVHFLHVFRLLEIEVRRDAVGGERRAVLHHRRAEIHVGIFPGRLYEDGERQAVNFQFVPGVQQPAGDGRAGVAGNKIQLERAVAVGIIPRLALGKMHLHFAGEHVGRELADEQDDDAGVRELDADFFWRQLKTINVRGDKIHQQHRAEQIAARQNQRDFVAENVRADHHPLLEIMRLRAVKPLVRLRQRAHEHEDDGERQQRDGQLQRREETDDFFNEHRFAGFCELIKSKVYGLRL